MGQIGYRDACSHPWRHHWWRQPVAVV